MSYWSVSLENPGWSVTKRWLLAGDHMAQHLWHPNHMTGLGQRD